MSRLVKKKKIEQEVSIPNQTQKSSLGVRDTDFLLRLIKRSTFEGSEIEQAYSVISKLGNIHRSYLED
tara:strand:+ start:1897 stop:2100 length:204 start_codon:yes stop_codon:yes gene_type:complete